MESRGVGDTRRGAMREEERRVQVILVLVGLQAVLEPGQVEPLRLRGGDHVQAEIEQQIIVDE